MTGVDYEAGEVSEHELPPIGANRIEGQTDIENGRRFLHLHRKDVRYVGTWNKWLVFDGQRWVLDDMKSIENKAKDVSASLFRQLSGESKTNELTFAKKSASAASIDAMLKMARSEVAIHHDALDSNPWLLNLENGTFDLKLGELRAFDREDFITKKSPTIYNPKADPDIWLTFLDRIFEGSDELVGYMQQLFGYCLTGVVAEHILPVLYGTGANGKSTLTNVLMQLLGDDYAIKMPRNMLMNSKYGEHATREAALFGKRFAGSVETEDGQRLAESLVKDLTGGDKITARRMREDFWQFDPTHKIWLATNHKPVIKGTDEGIWRRVKLIPFNVRIPDDEQDTKLGERLKSELSGILNWAIEGCQRWQQSGLIEPDCVKLATAEFRGESDLLGRFISENCVVAQSSLVAATRLFERYRAWDGNATQTAFGRAMAERGFERQRMSVGGGKKTCYRGIGLLSDEDE